MAQIVQLSAHLTSRGTLTPACQATAEQNVADQEALAKQLQLSASKENYDKFLYVISAHPVLVTRAYLDRLKEIQTALNKALVSIVERWWTDEKAKFPSRMPIAAHEEELLRWIDGPGKSFVPAFSGNQGVWRQDVLIREDGHPVLCEINSRLPLNGLVHSILGHDAIMALQGVDSPLVSAFTFEDGKDALFTMFNPEQPLYMIRDKWSGFGTHALLDLWPQLTGLPARYVKPEELRIVPSASSAMGFDLYCVASEILNTDIHTIEHGGERLEKIGRPLVELFQHEYQSLSKEMLHYLAANATNDFRSNLLTHDKRMFAILHEELDSLVHDHHILTFSEADLLRESIAPTYSPGSQRMKDLVQMFKSDTSGTLKDQYIAKKARSGFADGLIFGKAVSQLEWLELVTPLANDNQTVDTATHILQRIIPQQNFKIVLKDGESKDWFYRIGSYFALNGKWLGDGSWRIARDKVTSMAKGDEGHVGVAFLSKDDVA